MASAVTGDPPGYNFTSLAHIFTETVYVLIVYLINFIYTEAADALPPTFAITCQILSLSF